MHNPASNNKHSHGVEAYLILHMKPCRRQVYLVVIEAIWQPTRWAEDGHAIIVQGFGVSLQQ